MRIVETTEKFGEDGGDSRITVKVESNLGNKVEVSFGEGEPEDMYLFRDLSDVYHLVSLVKLAYDCGKAGEDLEIDNIVEE